MTLDLPTAAIVGGVVSAAGTAVAWIARTTVLDRITKLEQSRDRMGRRFGAGLNRVKAWQRSHDAVERERRANGRR